MEVKRHRYVELLPFVREQLQPSLTNVNPDISYTSTVTPTKFSFGEKGALLLVAWLTALSPLVPSSVVLRVYVYSAFITMSVFILSIIFDLHPSFTLHNIARF